MNKVPGETDEELARRIVRHAQKVADYAKLLEDDFDTGWESIVRLLVFKMELTRDAIAKGGHIEGIPRIAQEIDTVAALLKKALDHDYRKEVFREFDKKYGKPKITFHPLPAPKTGSLMVVLYRNGKPATEQMRKEMKRLWKLEDRMIQEDLNKAFKLISKQIRNWQD